MKIKAASLLLNKNLYPRHVVNDYHVAELQRAVEARETLPPVIADRKTLQLADGWHRITRALRYDGADAEIEVEWRDYKNDAELFRDAMILNARHGENLTPVDRVRCLDLGKRVGLTAEEIAAALLMKPEKLQAKRDQSVAKFRRETIFLKRSMIHLAGEQLSEEQVTCNKGALGVSQLFQVNSIIHFVESDSLDTADEELMERVAVLADLLQKYTKKARTA